MLSLHKWLDEHETAKKYILLDIFRVGKYVIILIFSLPKIQILLVISTEVLDLSFMLLDI